MAALKLAGTPCNQVNVTTYNIKMCLGGVNMAFWCNALITHRGGPKMLCKGMTVTACCSMRARLSPLSRSLYVSPFAFARWE